MQDRCGNCVLKFEAPRRRCPRCGYFYSKDAVGFGSWEPPDTPSFIAPDYVDEGMEVYTVHDGEWTRCRVAIASGHSARVVNKEAGVDRWRPISSLRIELKDVQALARLQD